MFVSSRRCLADFSPRKRSLVDTGIGLRSNLFLEGEPRLCEETSQSHSPAQPRLIRSQQVVMGLILLSTFAKEHQAEALNLANRIALYLTQLLGNF